MGEIKSVKVDNWGVFFLQKLQNFFNKTDYCDLTLQFRDNSQLKVHRLVLSACTDYFNVLEQTCAIVDEALIMPNELQADVVVPIVNFMYTGTLEFELKMYGKLLRTAKEMNMTVLLKLLEAHRRTMEIVHRGQRPPSPKPIRRRIGPAPAGNITLQQQHASPQRRILTTSNAEPQQQQQQQRRVVQMKSIATNVSQPQTQFRQQIGSTSMYKTTVTKSPHDTNYGTQQQFKRETEDYETSITVTKQQQTSPFEQLRKGYNNNKRPATATFISPPAKKPNIEDVKEFAEQQRMRKEIAAEYGDDNEYEGMLDDDIHNYDDDDDAAIASTSTTRQQQQPEHEQGTATITFKQEQQDKPPTIVVKDSSNSKMNHAKIISEVLRQYPHLVKSNKNIKLKILPNVGGQPQKIIVKKEQGEENATSSNTQQQQQTIKTQTSLLKQIEKPQTQTSTQKLQAIKLPVQKPLSSGTVAATTTSTTAAQPAQKRRIDSKTMHALIALGAENTTGPWLCLRCGVNGRPISIPSYRGFRRHLINSHKETIDPALCEHCGWRSSSNRELHFHMQIEHKIRTTLYTFPECLMCAALFVDTNALNQHMVDSHPDENKQQCIYCNKIFAKELQLYNHMKTYHKQQALEDGIIDYSDEEFMSTQDECEATPLPKKDTKIKILSDISLPSASALIKLDNSSAVAAHAANVSGASVASNDEQMHTSSSSDLNTEPKFVNADGNEMQLTDEQRKEIMSQLNQEQDGGGVVMVLNDAVFSAGEQQDSAAAAADEQAHEEEEAGDDGGVRAEDADPGNETGDEGSAAEDDFDDSQIYNEFTTQPAETTKVNANKAVSDAKVKKTATAIAMDESKESMDNLEWAENLISAHDMDDEPVDNKGVAAEKAKKDDDISKKLKELSGDWSDSENDDDLEDEDEVRKEENDEDEIEDDAVEEHDEAPIKADAKATEDAEEEERENVEALKVADIEKTHEKNSNENEEKDIAEVEEPKDMSTEEALRQLEDDDHAEIETDATYLDKSLELSNTDLDSKDEDDIDRAMKGLHKDEIEDVADVDVTKVAEPKQHEIKEEKENDAKKNVDTKDESMDVDAAVAEDAIEDKTVAAMKVDVEDVKVALEAVLKDDVRDNEDIEKVKSELDISFEANDTNALINDLIVGAEDVNKAGNALDELEFVAEKKKSVSEELDLETAKETSTTSTEPIEKSKNESENVAKTDTAAIAEESTQEVKETTEPTLIDTEKTEIASVTATTETPTSKTADKVKSLISEWAYESDDEDAENEQL